MLVLCRVICTSCGDITDRGDLQRKFAALNPEAARLAEAMARQADGADDDASAAKQPVPVSVLRLCHA